MNIINLLTFAGIYALFVISPGPGVAAVIARGMAQGTRYAAPYIAGFVVGDLIWFSIAASGLAFVAQTFAVLFTVIKFMGCAYLVFIAYKLWTSPIKELSIASAGETVNGWNSFFGSIAIALSNPKVIVFFMSILPLIVDMRQVTGYAAFEILVVIVMVFAPLQFSVLYGAKQLRRLFRTQQSVRRLNRTTAGVMLATAGAIASRP